MNNINIHNNKFLNKKARCLLMEIGIAAATNGYVQEALKIFDTLEIVGSNPICIAVGRCFAYATDNKLNKAFAELKRFWSEDSVSEIDMAMTLLAIKTNNLDLVYKFASRCEKASDKLLNDFAAQAYLQLENY